MKRSEILVGYSCNNHCLFCSTGLSPQINSTTEEIKGMIRKLKENNVDFIVFTGGEPTIREDIMELVSYAKHLKFKKIGIDTNGRMFYYKDFCERIIKEGANVFLISFLAHNEELYYRITGVKNQYKQTLKGIENLIGLKQEVVINIVIINQNYEFLDKMISKLYSRGVRAYVLSLCRPSGRTLVNFDKIIPHLDEVSLYLKCIIEEYGKKVKSILISNVPVRYLKGYESNVKELIECQKSELLGPDFEDLDLEGSKRKMYKHVSGCLRCKNREICPGISEGYLKRRKIEVYPY